MWYCSTMIKNSLSVVVPAHNEEDNLGLVIKDLISTIPKYTKNFEVIVVDDGSTDKTGKIADRWAKKNNKVRVLHNQPNRGFGFSYWRGVNNIKKEYSMMVWGDNAHTKDS